MPQADVITNGAYMLLTFPTFILMGFILSAVVEGFDVEDRIQNLYDLSTKTDASCFIQELFLQEYLEKMEQVISDHQSRYGILDPDYRENLFNVEPLLNEEALAEYRKLGPLDFALLFKPVIIESYISDALDSEFEFGISDDGKLVITYDILDEFSVLLEKKDST